MDSPTRVVFGDPSRDQLIESHLPLVHAIVNRIWAKGGIAGIERDDLVSEGAIGLINAADSFESDRRTRFSTWATIKIRSAVCNALNKQRARNKRESSGVNAEARADLLADTDLRDLDEDIVLHDGLRLLHTHDDRLCRVLEELYLHNKNRAEAARAEAAKALGISAMHVERLHQDALQFLREHFAAIEPLTDQV